MTGLSSDEVTPDDLINALLKTKCELLWFGGIGTYIKATHESNGDAGDRTNDSIRVNATEVRAKVVGEGANLGLTQAGRIEFARKGGRINTDAIDNSAGVDSSDHEVNIKILCSEAIRSGTLKQANRNDLLASMTDDVAAHVLEHNYSQTNALTLAESSAKQDHDAYERLMVYLENRDVLDRTVEGLPDSGAMVQRREDDAYLTRPELAVLMAWSKITLFDDIVASDTPDDPWFEQTLEAYFPDELSKFEDAMDAHRLKREIIATVLANRFVDAGGPIFLLRLREMTGASNGDLCAAFEAARAILDIPALRDAIHALDNKVPAQVQTELHLMVTRAIGDMTTALLEVFNGQSVGTIIETLQPSASALKDMIPDVLGKFEQGEFKRRDRSLQAKGLDNDLSRAISVLPVLAQLPFISRVCTMSGSNMDEAAPAYFTIGEALELNKVRSSATASLDTAPYWDRLATRRLVDDLVQQQCLATKQALEAGAARDWLNTHNDRRRKLSAQLSELSGNKPTFAQFTLSADAVRSFMRDIGEA